MLHYKVLLIATRDVIRGSQDTYVYTETELAYSDYYWFSSLDKAKAFCQQYFPMPIVWNENLCTEYQGCLNCNIYEEVLHLDITDKPDLPNTFYSPRDRD